MSNITGTPMRSLHEGPLSVHSLSGREDDPDSLMAQQLTYWQQTLAGLPERLALPTDRPHPPMASHRGARFLLHIDATLHGKLLALAGEHQASLFMVLHAALASLLTRLGADTDIPIGSPIAGPTDEAADELANFFVNTLVLRTDTSGNPSFSKLLQQARKTCLAAYAHHDLQFERLVEVLNPVRSTAHHPLFQVLLALQSNVQPPFDFSGAHLRVEDVASTVTPFDLSFYFNQTPDELGLEGTIEYATDLFDRQTIAQLAQRLVSLLEAIAQNPDQPIGGIELLDAAERQQLLVEWNATEREYPAQHCIHQLFEEQVECTPHATALVYEDQVLSYAELNAHANRLAHQLIELGVQPDARVAICVERSPAMVIGLLAILKAGGAYVPLDPVYPGERLMHILADAAPSILLADAAGRAALGETALASLTVLDPNRLSESATSNPHISALTPHHLAYIIYTSGSTGKPKGVMIEHTQITRLFDATEAWYHFDQNDTWCLFHSFAFDVSVWELWGALRHGGKLVLVPHFITRSPQEFYRLVCEQGVTVLNQTPSAFKPLISSQAQSELRDRLRYVIFAGEALEPTVLQEWYATRSDDSPQLLNMYGTTETTVHATYRPMRQQDSKQSGSPVGVRIPDLKIYLLDAYGQPVPLGVIGELYIGGAGVARGYLNRPELTAERFLSDPFCEREDARMYKTGDLARYLPDGNLEFLGRNDDQVKIRGFRIELGEIEARLIEHSEVREATVLALGEGGDKRLIAYVVAEPDEQLARRLREHLAAKLPEYMMPAAFVRLDALPLTPNGKLDRRALPEPEFVSDHYRAPRSPRERKLTELFAEILGVPRVGIDDSFFDLGGHSLLAMRLVSRIRKNLGVELTIRTLFETPTVTGLAQRFGQNTAVRPPLRRQQRPEPLPLSFAQRRQWFIQQLDGHSATYNIPFTLRLSGALDVNALQAAFRDLLARHESLRTGFTETNDIPAQRIFSVEELCFPLEAVEVTEESLPHTLSQAAAHPFNLCHEIPLRAALFQLDAQEHVLLVLLHHSAGDGWSLAPFARDLSQAYTARLHGGPPAWAQLPVQYADYTLWQRNLFSHEDDPDSLIGQQLTYWQQALAGLPERLTLPTDRPHPSIASHRGACFFFNTDPALYGKLLVLAREHQVSLFMVLQAALASLLTRLGAGTDIPVGSPIAGRTDEALDDLIGCFVNTLVLRTNTSGNPSFSQLLQQVKETCLAAYAHQDLQFERLVEVLNPPRSTAHHPLFQVLLALQNNALPQFDLPGLHLQAEDIELPVAKFDLSFHFNEAPSENGSGLSGIIQYATDLFDRQTIAQLAQRFVRLLEAIAQNSDQPIGCLELLDDTERQQLLVEWNDTARPVHKITLPALFEAQVAKAPDAIALAFEEQSISYAELNAQANRLAHYLIAQGIGPEDVVAIAIPRSPYMVIALLAALKAGAAYLPLDPHSSAERLFTTLSDAQPAVLLRLSQDTLASAFLALQLDDPELQATLETYPETAPTDQDRIRPLDPRHPAYVIYTSGSTGTPKGVIVTHASLINYIHAITPWINKNNHMVWISNVAADLGNTSLYGAIFSGGKLIIVDDDETLNSELFAKKSLKDECTLKITPSHLASLMKSLPQKGDDSKKMFFLGGERVDGNIAAAIKLNWRGSRVVNHYGPTETTIGVLIGELQPEFPLETTPFLPLGQPISNTQVYVLDNGLQPVPISVGGELYIAGAGLARGYLGRPGLTAERFVANPFGPPGSRMYRSGDFIKWRADGLLDFLGRTDDQVKIRGFRIELGEIEAVLRRNPVVEQVAVIAREDHAGAKQLISYVVAHADGTPIDPVVLRRQLAQQLPDYMVPAAIIVLEALPLTPNGKLDRKALPAPDFTLERFRAPSTSQEHALATLFAKVLGLPRVGIDDSFFDLGGHSLSAVQLTLRIQEVFKVKVPVRMLFEADSVAKLAERIESNTLIADQAEASDGTEQLMMADAILAEDVTKKVTSNDFNGAWENVLLTGATGFVGRYLLIELLQQTNAHIICLVNSENEQAAKKRIVSALKEIGRQDIDINRFSTLCGDLSKENLGLAKHQLTVLSDKLDAIVHNGAAVNHFFSYHELRQANVLATETLIRLAATGRDKSLHYVSTLSVAAQAASGIFTEESDTSTAPKANGYVQSKWVAEQLISAAATRGIPCSIYRLGRITADSTNGYCNTHDSTYRIIRAIALLGLSFNTTKRFLQTPVDYAARAIVKLAGHQNKHLQITHIIAHQSLELHEFVKYINHRESVAIENISFGKWVKELRRTASETQNENLMALLSITEHYESDEEKGDSFKNSQPPIVMCAKNTMNRLHEIGFEYPHLGDHYIESVVSFLLDRDVEKNKKVA